VSLVEWPEKAGELLPSPDVGITLVAKGSGRSASLQSSSPSGREFLERTAVRFDFTSQTS
jgi:tRNA threonylcarbamoyladenosine biosynthesis protein TsaE